MTAALLLAMAAAASLDEQTLAATLERELNREGVSFLLFDAHDGRRIAARWPDAEKPIPVGSLVKPFTALAYGASHSYRYPAHDCRTGCWLPRGHGRVHLVEALAQSCNTYFERLERDTAHDDARRMAERFGFDGPPAGASLIGRSDGWKAPPVALVRAYAELARRAGEPGVQEILQGLAASAARGTARAIGPGALAKTGTAPCTHAQRAPGDGFVIALFPEREPRFAVMVRVHSAPGAAAAAALHRAVEAR